MKNIILQSSPSEWKEALHELGIDLPLWLILLLVMIILVLGWVIKHYWCNWQEARNWRKKKMKAIANTDFSPDFDYASPILDFSIFRGQNRHFCPRLVSFEHQTRA